MDQPSSRLPKGIRIVLGGVLAPGLTEGGAAGVVSYNDSRAGQEEANRVAVIADAWLKAHPQITQELGPITKVDHRNPPVRLTSTGSHGEAGLWHTLVGGKNRAEGEVWLEQPAGGTWTVLAAGLKTADGRPITLGKPPPAPPPSNYRGGGDD